jgi:hypothetical protein
MMMMMMKCEKDHSDRSVRAQHTHNLLFLVTEAFTVVKHTHSLNKKERTIREEEDECLLKSDFH